MEVGRPQSAPAQRSSAPQRPLTAPASRSNLRSSESQRVRFSEGQDIEPSAGTNNPMFWALPPSEQNTAPHDLAGASSPINIDSTLCSSKPIPVQDQSATSMQSSEKRVSFKGLHLEKAAIEDYRLRQQKMALRCVTSLDGWEETKNSLIASVLSVTSPDVALTDKARKTVLNSLLSNFFALLHVPSFSVEYLNLNLELQSKVPSFLLQLQKDVKERQGMEITVDLNDRETKQGILGTYGKQYMIEAFINGISLAREDEESNMIVRRAALNEEFRKLGVMRKELESSSASVANQRKVLDDLGAKLKSKDQRIDELERQVRRREDSHAEQVANLLKEIHSLKTNYSKATSVAQATAHGIQNAIMASSKQQHQSESPSKGSFVVDSARLQVLDPEHKKLFQTEHNRMLDAHEKRIRVLEDALCNAQANNLSDSLSHRNTQAIMISWASSTLKFEEDLFAAAEKIFRADMPVSATTLAVSGKQLAQPQTNEKLTSLLALTQEISKVSIEISKMSTQKLSKFYKLLQFANDLLTFIENGDLTLPADLEFQKRDLFQKDLSSASNDIIMFPENHKVQHPISTEDVELKRIFGKDRKGFRNSLLDLLLEFHRKNSETQKSVKPKHESGQDSRHVSNTSTDIGIEKEAHRRDASESTKFDHSKSKVKAAGVATQSHNLSSPVASPKLQFSSSAGNMEIPPVVSIVRASAPLDDQSLATLTKQRDEYMERLNALSAELAQLQISMHDIHKQRAEMQAKSTKDFDEMAMTIFELKKDKDAVSAQTKRGYAHMSETIAELKQEREALRNQLSQFIFDEKNENQDSPQLQDKAIGAQDMCDDSKAPHGPLDKTRQRVEVPNIRCFVADSVTESDVTPSPKYKTDASCQTIEDWQLSKHAPTDIKTSADRTNESLGVTDLPNNAMILSPAFKIYHQATENSTAIKSQISHTNENGADLGGPAAVTTAAQMIFEATNRNLQANFSNKRAQSVFDEFDERVSDVAQCAVHVPKIDLSSAFLMSVGETQAHHFQQNGSYLPRFQKVSIKQKIDQKVGLEAPSQSRFTKNSENLMSQIAPVIVSSSSIRAKKYRPGVSVLEIPPSAFDVPASHFSQPPYTSRPSTSNNMGLFIGADIKPETARSSNGPFRPNPHRPTTARSADGNNAKRNAHIMRTNHDVHHIGAAPSPSNPHTLSKDQHHQVETLEVEESPGIGIKSSILNAYLNEIRIGQPS